MIMLTIIAMPTVEQSRLDEIKSAMLELVQDTLKEEGCIRYELHQNNEEPHRFVFIESWQNREMWQKHMNGAAIQQFNQKIAGGIKGFELYELSQIS